MGPFRNGKSNLDQQIAHSDTEGNENVLRTSYSSTHDQQPVGSLFSQFLHPINCNCNPSTKSEMATDVLSKVAVYKSFVVVSTRHAEQ